MEQSKLERINELAHLAKQRALTAAEQSERDQLRAEYIAEYRENLRSQLDNIIIQRPDGSRERLKKKGE